MEAAREDRDPTGAGAQPDPPAHANSLFGAFGGLAGKIPWRPIGTFPTPVEELPSPVAGVRFFVKRDDLSSPLYGGNKVRKLEHLLAAAERTGRQSLVTMGGLGSNHALATVLHGGAAGMAVELALYDQPITPLVRRNLAAFLHAGARIHYGKSLAGAFLEARRAVVRLRREGRAPAFIMVGGTSPLGCIGHVTAALELAAQVRAGQLPEPDLIYVPLGTCGTAAGLVAGLRIAGLRTRVVAVRVADPIAANAFVVRRLAQLVADRLHRLDPAVPRLAVRKEDFEVVTDFMGPGYGVATREAEAAVEWAAPRLKLETTYSGKTLAAALSFAHTARRSLTMLFWNSYSSAPVPAPSEWPELPAALRHVAAEPPI